MANDANEVGYVHPSGTVTHVLSATSVKVARLVFWLLVDRRGSVSRRRPPDFRVVREEGAVYLNRWHLVPRNNWFNVYLHQMLRDDDDVLHDHPYSSLSLVLADGLVERWVEDVSEFCQLVRRKYPEETVIDPAQFATERVLYRGQLVWRSSRMAHQLVVVRPAWTLFVTGPRVREWGFWCPRGWRPWRQYVDTRDQTEGGAGTSKVGRGCGEA